MRFAVHRPTHRSASPNGRSVGVGWSGKAGRGTSCRDVLGRVHIRIIEMPAGTTPKNRLALTILRVAMTTGFTRPGCVRGIDLLHVTGSRFLQPGDQPTPSGSMNGSVESRLGSNARSRRLRGAASRPDQISDLQVLDSDDVESARQIGGDRFDPILTPVRLTGLQAGDRARSRLGPGKLSPEPPQPPLFGCTQAGCNQKVAGRKSRRHGNASINADDLAGARPVDRSRNNGEGDMPAPRPIPRDAIGLRVLGNGTGPAKPYPADFRYPYPADVARHPAYIPLPPSLAEDPESLTPARLAPRRPAVDPGDEVRHGLGEIPESLLLHGLGTRRQPRELLSGLGQLTGLFGVARCALPARPPMPMLLYRKIPDKSRVCAVLQQPLLLNERGLKTKSHARTLSAVTDKRRRERCFPSAREAGGQAPRIR